VHNFPAPLDLNGTVRINLNCSFQSAAGKTYCKWKSSGDEQNPNSIFDFGDYYNDWKLHNSTLYEDNGHGASKNHFEGKFLTRPILSKRNTWFAKSLRPRK